MKRARNATAVQCQHVNKVGTHVLRVRTYVCVCVCVCVCVRVCVFVPWSQSRNHASFVVSLNVCVWGGGVCACVCVCLDERLQKHTYLQLLVEFLRLFLYFRFRQGICAVHVRSGQNALLRRRRTGARWTGARRRRQRRDAHGGARGDQVGGVCPEQRHRGPDESGVTVGSAT